MLTGLCLWAGRAVWRAQRDLVTLHVRNRPLAEVISRLERQTGETIVTDARLDEQITLYVDDAPLREVLDRIGAQAGAQAMTVHAVHRSRNALSQLRDELRRGALSQDGGWTRLAPNLDLVGDVSDQRMSAPPGMDGSAPSQGRPHEIVQREPYFEDRRETLGESKPIRGSENPSRSQMVQGVRVDGGTVLEEIITPEAILIETGLTNRVHAETPLDPDLATAQAIARKAQARCTTLYTLRKSALASLAGPRLRQVRFRPAKSGPDGSPDWEPPSLEAAERQAQRDSWRRFQELTPEQRARRVQEQHAGPPF